jgi:hypothetical protein
MKGLVLAAIAFAAIGCGRVEHKVSGGAQTRSDVNVTVTVDISLCDELVGEDKAECVNALAKLAAIAAEEADSAE